MPKEISIRGLKRLGMMKTNLVISPMVSGLKVSRNGVGNNVDETYYNQLVDSVMYLIATILEMMLVTYLINRYITKN